MDTVRLLDTYRVAIMRDRDAIRLLAFLQREGPQDEETLARLANVPLTTTRLKLTNLFRANLVVTQQSRFVISDLADVVLTRTGISEVVTQELIRTASLPDEHRLILVSCVDEWKDEPLEWRRYLSAAVRALARLTRYVRLDGNVATRHWYAAIAGLDPKAHELGAERYARFVWSNSARLKAPPTTYETLFHYCRQAVLDRAASNDFLVTGHHSSSDVNDPTLGLTFTRLVASAVSRYLDEGLAAATSAHGIHSEAIRQLSEWAKPFETEYIVFFDPSWRASAESRRPGLVDALIDIFRKRQPTAAALSYWHATASPQSTAGDHRSSFTAELLALEDRVTSLAPGELHEAIRILENLKRDLTERAQREPHGSRSS